MSFQGVGGIRDTPLRFREGTFCFPASVSGICFPLPSLSPVEGASGNGERMPVPACQFQHALWGVLGGLEQRPLTPGT